jgi:hypothetical protein
MFGTWTVGIGGLTPGGLPYDLALTAVSLLADSAKITLAMVAKTTAAAMTTLGTLEPARGGGR